MGPARRPRVCGPAGAAAGATGGARGQAGEGRAVQLDRRGGAGGVLRRLPALRRRLPARVPLPSPAPRALALALALLCVASQSVSAHSPSLTPRATSNQSTDCHFWFHSGAPWISVRITLFLLESLALAVMDQLF